MDRNMSANIAGIAGAAAMLGVTMASRKLGIAYVEPVGEDLVESAVEATNSEAAVTEKQEEALGLGVHLGFSMTSAMLYARLRHHLSLPGPAAGALFGLALWLANMVGAAPMLGIRQSPWKENEARAITTIVAHVLFGVVVGFLFDQLVEEDKGN